MNSTQVVFTLILILILHFSAVMSGAFANPTGSAQEPDRGLLVGNGESIASASLEMMYGAQTHVTSIEFLLRDDLYGLMKMALARAAARKGLEVFLQVDAFHLLLKPEYVVHLMNEGVNFRLYNDNKFHQFNRLGHRDHSKVLVIDKVIKKLGDSNTGDEYAQFGDGHHMVSYDMVVAGKSAQEAYAYAMRMFSSPLSTAPLFRVASKEEVERQRAKFQRTHNIVNGILKFARITMDAPQALTTPRERLVTQEEVEEAGRMLDWAYQKFLVMREIRQWPTLEQIKTQMSPIMDASFHSDPVGEKGLKPRLDKRLLNMIKSAPEKILRFTPFAIETKKESEKIGIHRTVYDFMKTARKRLIIVSPYLILSPEDKALIKELLSKGVEVLIYTNSLSSSDNAMTQSAYEMRVEEIAALGPVQIYEWVGLQTWHAKILIKDSEDFMVKGFNMDYRSKYINLETGFFGRSPQIAQEIELIIKNFGLAFNKVAEGGKLLPHKVGQMYKCIDLLQPTVRREFLKAIEKKL